MNIINDVHYMWWPIQKYINYSFKMVIPSGQNNFMLQYLLNLLTQVYLFTAMSSNLNFHLLEHVEVMYRWGDIKCSKLSKWRLIFFVE